jgi:hypothetical protein
LHVPAVKHAAGALHVTEVTPVHTPVSHLLDEKHSSLFVHVVPLATSEYTDVLTPGWHVWQPFAGFATPLATHALPM